MLTSQFCIAQTSPDKAGNSLSIELGNLDEPEEVAAEIKTTPKAESSAFKANSAAASAVSSPTDNPDNKITVGEKPAESPAQTPMERYRDLKLQQASTQHAGNPAAMRRYLKVDRSAFADSNGVQ